MEPLSLLNLMKEKSTSFFVMDVRDSVDFKASHVQLVFLKFNFKLFPSIIFANEQTKMLSFTLETLLKTLTKEPSIS